eukprot:6194335-Pleurochrysis_carterae.AAC.5
MIDQHTNTDKYEGRAEWGKEGGGDEERIVAKRKHACAAAASKSAAVTRGSCGKAESSVQKKTSRRLWPTAQRLRGASC